MPYHKLPKNVYLEKIRSALQQIMMLQTFRINIYDYQEGIITACLGAHIRHPAACS